MKMAVVDAIAKSHSYAKYRDLVSKALLVADETDAYLEYTKLNEARMNRLDKKLAVPADVVSRILALKNPYTWLVLSEGWCGDAAQLLPVMNKLALLSSEIDFKIAFRDENPKLMDAFLTNGSRSIPKLIVLDTNTFELRASWGPRPKPAADLISSYKRQYGSIDQTAMTELQLWYSHDKGRTAMLEIIEMMEELETSIYLKR